MKLPSFEHKMVVHVYHACGINEACAFLIHTLGVEFLKAVHLNGQLTD